MTRFSPRQRCAFIALACASLCNCRTKPPVVRHFLRLPADCAGSLSTIERAKWYKESRRQLPSRRELAASGYLTLPPFASGLGTRVSGMDVLLADRTGSGAEGLAVLVRSGTGGVSQPRLLRCDRGQYIQAGAPGISLPDASWFFNAERDTVTAHGTAGKAIRAWQWNGSAWQAEVNR